MQRSRATTGPAERPGSGWRQRRLALLAVISLQIAVPTLMLVLRLTGDGTALRFGWHMFSGVP